jgi:cation diffusion facilitator CzcD-associated flavoprotein CzcO
LVEGLKRIETAVRFKDEDHFNEVKNKGEDSIMLDLIIIGAGPFGISLAAHAAAQNLSYQLLGYPMDFWKNQMPQDMFIRTPPEFVSLSDPQSEFIIQRFSEETGVELPFPLPRPIFVEYAFWFAAKTNVSFTPELVSSLEKCVEGYTVRTERGSILNARNIIVATGVQHFMYMPEIYAELPSDYVSHTFGYIDFIRFAGKKVAVVGSGQSAWEAAALLYKAGSDAELFYRGKAANYSGSVADEIELRDMGDVFYGWPLEKKREEWGQSPGSVAHFLRPYVEEKVPESGNVRIDKIETTADKKVRIKLSNGETRVVDHIISASGYRINVDRIPFIQRNLLQSIAREEDDYKQFPRLNANFESSLPGLYFAGPLSSHSHGPTFRFILGLRKTCESIIPHIIEKMVQ